MKKVLILIMFSVLLIPLVDAHAVDKGPVSKSTDDYIIEFSTNPKFPITGKDMHLDFIIKDKEQNFIQDADVKIELHQQETTITLNLNEKEKGHYSLEYNLNDAGDYEIHIVIDNKELETEFDLEIDSFGLSGLLRSGTIVLLLLILVWLMYKDCRREENGEKSTNIENTRV